MPRFICLLLSKKKVIVCQAFQYHQYFTKAFDLLFAQEMSYMISVGWKTMFLQPGFLQAWEKYHIAVAYIFLKG